MTDYRIVITHEYKIHDASAQPRAPHILANVATWLATGLDVRASVRVYDDSGHVVSSAHQQTPE